MQISEIINRIKNGEDSITQFKEELRRLFAVSSRLFADEDTLSSSNINDLNTEYFYSFVRQS